MAASSPRGRGGGGEGLGLGAGNLCLGAKGLGGFEGSNGTFDGCKPQKVGVGTLVTPLRNLFLRCLHKDMAASSPRGGGGHGARCRQSRTGIGGSP